MKNKWNISQMCANLESSYLVDLEPDGELSAALSAQRIKALALEKLHHQESLQKEKPMKKKLTKILLCAALTAALTVSAVAAFGGLEYFRSLFGDSAGLVQEQIQMPEGAVDQNEQYRLRVESLLTDGYTTSIVVSVSDLSGGKLELSTDRLFHVESDAALVSVGWGEMEEFSTPYRQYYHIEAAANQRFDSAALTVAMAEEIAPLRVSVTAENGLGVIEMTFPEEDFAGNNYRTQSLQVSPMGFFAIGVETEVKGGLPSPSVLLRMKDGTIEVLTDEMTFDGSADDEETISGGGSAVIVESWQQAPLVITSYGARNPENQMITTGYFSRILDLNEVEAVIIDGREYPVKR